MSSNEERTIFDMMSIHVFPSGDSESYPNGYISVLVKSDPPFEMHFDLGATEELRDALDSAITMLKSSVPTIKQECPLR
jgi:hypothetical protein